MSPNYLRLSRNSLDPNQTTASQLWLDRPTLTRIAKLVAETQDPMSETVNYTAREFLRDGSQIDIRALRREDEADMLAAVDRASSQSLQRRFFAMKRHFSTKSVPS